MLVDGSGSSLISTFSEGVYTHKDMTKRAYLLACFCLLAVFAFVDRPAFSQAGKDGTAKKKGGAAAAIERAREDERRQLAAPWIVKAG